MPRVNRDLQRRLAARREREQRRRPTAERRYRFPSPEQAVAPEDAELGDGTEASTTETVEPPRREARTAAATRGATARPPARTFADYASEYAYVLGDLRRVAVVIGSLLVILITMYFVLPH